MPEKTCKWVMTGAVLPGTTAGDMPRCLPQCDEFAARTAAWTQPGAWKPAAFTYCAFCGGRIFTVSEEAATNALDQQLILIHEQTLAPGRVRAAEYGKYFNPTLEDRIAEGRVGGEPFYYCKAMNSVDPTGVPCQCPAGECNASGKAKALPL